jgi:SAM-dependent methyltransferase
MDEMSRLVQSYAWPSEAFWRYFELKSLQRHAFQRPILELGCGSGKFSEMLVEHIEDAIDVNPVAVKRCRTGTTLYGRVRCLDARDLEAEQQYGTVFANCVLEHISGIGAVLQGVRGSLRAGGELVATVPLRTMNDHLRFRSPRYAAARQQQLVHVNLFSTNEWDSLLHEYGFSNVRISPYLFASQCEFWDSIDWLACAGVGRYRVAAVVSRLVNLALPSGMHRRLASRIAAALLRHANAPPRGEPCAVTIVAS